MIFHGERYFFLKKILSSPWIFFKFFFKKEKTKWIFKPKFLNAFNLMKITKL